MSTDSMARLLAERLEEEGERAGAEITVEGLLERWVPYGVARSSLDLTTKSEYDLLVLQFLADRRLTVLGDPAVAEAAAEELETPEPGLDPLEEHAGVTLRLDLATISGGYRGAGVEADPEAEGAASGGEEPGEGAASPPAGGGSEEARDGTAGSDADDEDEDGGDATGAVVEGWDPTGGVDARPTLDAGGESEAGGEPEASDRSGRPGRSGRDDRSVDIGPGSGRSAPGDAGDSGSPGPDGECRSCGETLPVDVDVPVRFCPSCGAARPERACPECGARLRPEWSYCPACGTHASPSGGVSDSGPEGVDAGEWEPE